MRNHLWLFLALLAAGCASPKVEQIVPLNKEQTEALVKRARPPQMYGITAYSGDNGPVFAGACRVHEGDLAELSFLGPDNSTAPVVTLSETVKEGLPVLLDTSSRENWFTLEASQRLHWNALGAPQPYTARAQHVYDEVGGFAGVVQHMKFDALRIENVVVHSRAALGPLGPPARWVTEPAPVGVLGTTFLRSLSYATIDYPARKVLLSATKTLPAANADRLLTSVPMKDQQGTIAVEGLLDGMPTTLILDIAGDYELVMAEIPPAGVKRLIVGELYFPGNITVVTGMDQGMGPIRTARIGRRILAKYALSLDFRQRQIHFLKPAGR